MRACKRRLVVLLAFFCSSALGAVIIDPLQTTGLETWVTTEGALLPDSQTSGLELEVLAFGDFSDSTLRQEIVDRSISITVGAKELGVIEPDLLRKLEQPGPNGLLLRIPLENTGGQPVMYRIARRIRTTTQWPRVAASVQPPSDFSRPSPLVRSNDPKLVALAETIPRGTNDLETVQNTILFVHHYLSYEGASIGTPQPSNEMISRRAGTCNGYSNLAAALLRQKGYPVRMVLGLAFDGKNWNEHAWIEVYTKQGWIASDPTFAEPIADATHLALAKGIDFESISDKIRFTQGQPVRLFRQFDVVVQASERYASSKIVNASLALEPSTMENGRLQLQLTNLLDAYVSVPITWRSPPGKTEAPFDEFFVLAPLGSLTVYKPVQTLASDPWTPEQFEVESPLWSPALRAQLAPVSTGWASLRIHFVKTNNQVEVSAFNPGPATQFVRLLATTANRVVWIRELSVGPQQTESAVLSLEGLTNDPLEITAKNDSLNERFFVESPSVQKPVDWIQTLARLLAELWAGT